MKFAFLQPFIFVWKFGTPFVRPTLFRPVHLLQVWIPSGILSVAVPSVATSYHAETAFTPHPSLALQLADNAYGAGYAVTKHPLPYERRLGFFHVTSPVPKSASQRVLADSLEHVRGTNRLNTTLVTSDLAFFGPRQSRRRMYSGTIDMLCRHGRLSTR